MITWEGWVTLATVALMVFLLARDRLAPSLAVFGAVVFLLVLGIIEPAEAFAGFSNPAPMTVAALYIVARAVEKTGGVKPIISAALGSGAGQRGSLARLLLPSAGASAFLNNTPLVAMLVGPVTEWADRAGRSPSRYLMPLSFAVTLGGVMTTIGTSTNLIVSGLLESRGQPPLALFELTPIALPIALAGLLTIVVLAPIVLPDRRAPRDILDGEETGAGGSREFALNMIVTKGGLLDGRAVEAGGLRHLQGVYLVQVTRGGQVIAPVDPALVLQGGDQLTFVGRADMVVDLQSQPGLVSAERQHIDAFDTTRQAFFEVVIGPASPLLGRTLAETGFRSRYQAAVIAIHRAGHRVREKLGTVELHVGDTLMLLADPGFRDRWRDRNDFLVVSSVGGPALIPTRKAPIVWIVALGVVLVAGSGMLPILQASLLGAVALVLFGVLTPGEARSAVDLDVIVLVAASFGVAAAMEKTGLAAMVANGLVSSMSGFGATGALLGVTLATIAITSMVTNNAAAVIVFPVAVSAAQAVGSEPRGFALAVAMGASASFLTPIAYQTNTMVYGPGGYRFSDYARLGAPLTLVVLAGVVILVPLLG